jgi:antitoxin PrlF
LISSMISSLDLSSSHDPAIKSFLSVLERDIQAAQHVNTLPEDLARSMLATLANPVDLDDDIVGDVAL